jgi:catechol 2,3-dioxygenase-like lactoylglutathione lyase family enzyme
MIKGIATVMFKVSDINRSCDFFEKKLGLKIAYREANWAEVDLNAVHLGLMQAEPAGGARNPFLSLLVDDIAATVATLNSAAISGTSLSANSSPLLTPMAISSICSKPRSNTGNQV